MIEIHVFLRMDCDPSVPPWRKRNIFVCINLSGGARSQQSFCKDMSLCAWREIHVLAVRDRSCFWSHDISLRTQKIPSVRDTAGGKRSRKKKCKGRWFPVSSRTQVETQATHLATAKDARSTNAAVHEYVFGRGGDFACACAAASLMRET